MSVAKEYSISIDTIYKILGETISLVKGDTGGNIFNFTITKAGVVLDLTGTTITITMAKPDGNEVVNSCAITDATSGKCTYTVSTQAISAVGNVTYTLEIYNNGARTTTTQSKFKVVDELSDGGGATSSNEYNVLSELIASVNTIESDIISNDGIRTTNENTRIANENARKVWETYNPSKPYIPGNKVCLNGSSYVNIVGCTGVSPTEGTDNANWVLIVSKGDKGDTGEQGPIGPSGSGSGDMVASSYDTNGDNVVNAADVASSVPWTGVTNPPAFITQSVVDNLAGTGRTTETVKATNDSLVDHKTDYTTHIPHLGIATDSTGLGAYDVTTSCAIGIGDRFTLTMQTASSGGNVTLSLNGGTSYNVNKQNGDNKTSMYSSSYLFYFDGSAFIALGEGGEYGTATASDVRSTKTLGTENGVVQGTLDLTNLTADVLKKDVTVAGITGNKLLYGVGDTIKNSQQSYSYINVSTSSATDSNLAIDSLGNVYSTNDTLIYKHASDGTLVWSYTISGSKNHIYVDSSNNFYYSNNYIIYKIAAGNDPNSVAPVAVSATASGTISCFSKKSDTEFYIGTSSGVVEFHSNNAIQWGYTISSSGAAEVCYDAANNRAIAKSRYSTNYNIYIVTSTGATILVTIPSGSYVYNSLQVDSSGNVYLASLAGTGAIYKYNSVGTLLWSVNPYIYSTAGRAFLDANENYFMLSVGAESAASTSNSTQIGRGYSPNGVLIWQYRLMGTAYVDNSGFAKAGVFGGCIFATEYVPYTHVIQTKATILG